MKTTTILGTLIFSLLLVLACGEETTELRWDQQDPTTTAVYDIQWMRDNSSPVDATWDGELAYEAKSDFKKVSVLTGVGVCYDSDGVGVGTEYDIFVNGYNAVTLDEGSSNTLTIDTIQTK